MSVSAVDNPWRTEALDLVRAVSGGLLFGVPLLYTMEVWWTGQLSPSWTIALLGILLFVTLLIMNKTEGFRSTADIRWRDALADAVESVAIALVVTALMLVLIREITVDTPRGAALGKIFYESVPFGLGIGVARHLLGGGRAPDEDPDAKGGSDASASPPGGEVTGKSRFGLNPTVADLGATLIGASFVALSISPTDEVPMIASAMTPGWLLALMAVSLVVSYAIVFVAGFANQDHRHGSRGPLQRPMTETAVCYLIAIAVSVVLLWAFQRADLPWPELLAQAIVLGFPAAIGGAAGRLAV